MQEVEDKWVVGERQSDHLLQQGQQNKFGDLVMHGLGDDST